MLIRQTYNCTLTGKKVQFPTLWQQNWLLKKRQYFCKHAVSSFLSQPHEEGRSRNGKYTVHRKLFVNEVKFLFDNISHIYHKRGTWRIVARKCQLSHSLQFLPWCFRRYRWKNVSHMFVRRYIQFYQWCRTTTHRALFKSRTNFLVIHKTILK